MSNSSKEIIYKARQEILINKNPDDAIKLLLESIEHSGNSEFYKNLSKTTLALAYQEKKEYAKAAEIYKEAGEKYQAGFCELLLGNKLEAERLWCGCSSSPAVQWGRCLLDFINLRPQPRVPSYLQIRNFLEMDISYFITANKLSYAENVIKNENVLVSVNLESYKLIGRVLLNFGFLNMAKKYLIKSVEIVDQDSETFYHLGQYNYEIGAYPESITMLKRCLELNSYYVPAAKFLKKVYLKMSS
jgi:tetratricopeptide (TPR) repeat protein